jgi:hypothetical protein
LQEYPVAIFSCVFKNQSNRKKVGLQGTMQWERAPLSSCIALHSKSHTCMNVGYYVKYGVYDGHCKIKLISCANINREALQNDLNIQTSCSESLTSPWAHPSRIHCQVIQRDGLAWKEGEWE